MAFKKLKTEWNLSEADAQLLQNFTSTVVEHRNLQHARHAVLARLHSSVGRSLIPVVGPPGVGKTLLSRIIQSEYLKSCQAELAANPGLIPLATVELLHPERGSFDWITYYRGISVALKDGLLDRQVIRCGGTSASGRRSLVDTAREAAESAMALRGLRYLQLDEAHHMLVASTTTKLTSNLEVIKSRTSITKVPHILYGTYSLLAGLNSSGQTVRRTKVIHVRRYDPLDQADVDEFGAYLYSLCEASPIPFAVEFIDEVETAMIRCVGCPGVLKDWMSEALLLAFQRGMKKVSMTLIDEAALTSQQLVALANEIVSGEEWLETGHLDNVRAILLKSAAAVNLASPKRPKRGNAFKRAPRRDTVGIDLADA